MTETGTMTEIFAETPCQHAKPCRQNAGSYWNPDYQTALGRRTQAKAVGSAASALFHLIARTMRRTLGADGFVSRQRGMPEPDCPQGSPC